MSDQLNSYRGSSLERWIVGHQMFFVEIQVIILSINAYERAPSDAGLQMVADLIRGSATSMQLAGNFTGAAYEPVRDSMAHLDKDFSGLFSADHRVMIGKLTKLKRSMENGSRAYYDLKDAIEIAYRAHAHVCQRFVGDQGSLANESSVAWRTILSKYLPRALSKIGFRLVSSAKHADQNGPRHK